MVLGTQNERICMIHNCPHNIQQSEMIPESTVLSNSLSAREVRLCAVRSKLGLCPPKCFVNEYNVIRSPCTSQHIPSLQSVRPHCDGPKSDVEHGPPSVLKHGVSKHIGPPDDNSGPSQHLARPIRQWPPYRQWPQAVKAS